MVDFTGLGAGFAAGSRIGAARSMNRQDNQTRLLLQERAQQEQQRQQNFQRHFDITQNAYEVAGTIGTKLLEDGAPRKEVVSQVRKMIDDANANADRMARVFPDFDPTPFKSRGNAILDTLAFAPTLEEKKMAEAKAEAKGEVTGAQTRAPYIGEEAARLTIPGAKDKATLDVSRRQVAVSERQQREPDIINFVMPDRTQKGVNRSSPDAAIAVQQILAAGGVAVGMNVQAENIGGISLPKSSSKDFLESQVAALNMIDAGDRLLEMLPEKDVLTGWASSIVRGLSSLAGNVQQLALATGGTVEGVESELELLNPTKYDLSAFGDVAARSAAFRTNVINYAYAAARGREPGGRLSTQDVQTAIDALAASSGDKAQIEAAIKETQREAKVNYANRRATFESFTGQKLPDAPEILNLDDEGDLVKQYAKKDKITTEEWSKLTDDQKRKVLEAKGLMGDAGSR